MSKIVMIGNIKGGAGKSSLTMAIANWLHRIKNKRVLVMDCDTLQQTIMDDRKYSLSNGVNEKDLYKVLTSSPKDALEILEYVKDDYDFIFMDIPGNFMEEGVISLSSFIDFLIIPMRCTPKDETATSRFLKLYAEYILPVRKKNNLETKIQALLYMVNSKGRLYKNFKRRIESGELPIPYFKSVVPWSEVLENESDTVNVSEYINANFEMKNLYKEVEIFLNV